MYWKRILINHFDERNLGIFPEITGKTGIIISYGYDTTFPRMKTLAITRDEKKDRATVECADGEVSIYRNCAFCIHCKGIRIGEKLYPSPQDLALKNISGGISGDEALMNAAMQFNSLAASATAIECDDDQNTGFRSRYQR
jgi:hypothetical protein